MSLTDLLPQTATIQQKTTTADGYGGSKVTWSNRRTGYRCRIDIAAEGQVYRLASGEEAISTHDLLGEDYEVHAGDRIVANGQTYEVLGPDWPACRVYGKSNTHHVEAALRTV